MKKKSNLSVLQINIKLILNCVFRFNHSSCLTPFFTSENDHVYIKTNQTLRHPQFIVFVIFESPQLYRETVFITVCIS